MFQAKFKLKHKGCWTNGLNQFKSEFNTHNTISFSKDLVQDITEVSLYNKKELKKIKNYFKNHQLIKKVEILEETNRKLLIQIFTKTKPFKSIANIILKNRCFLFNKVPLVMGFEIWTIAAPKKCQLKNAIEEIKKHGTFKLLHIKQSSFDGFNFSPSQETTFKLAIQQGYYNWPRKVSLTELANKLKLSKSTVSEHLRKAEIKIISKEFYAFTHTC